LTAAVKQQQSKLQPPKQQPSKQQPSKQQPPKKIITTVCRGAARAREMDKAAALAGPGAPRARPASDTLGLRYILGRVRAMCRHSPAEIDSIAEVLLDVRLRFHVCKHDWLQHVPPIFIGFHGFATDFERSVFLRVLKFATKPRVLNSTFLPSSAFEGFAILHPTTTAADVQHLEKLFELFKMSASVTDFGLYMSALMVACIERVEAGARPYRNFRSQRAGNVRTAYAHAKQKRDTAVQLARVQAETGLPFTRPTCSACTTSSPTRRSSSGRPSPCSTACACSSAPCRSRSTTPRPRRRTLPLAPPS